MRCPSTRASHSRMPMNIRLVHTSCRTDSFMCQLYFTQLFSSYNYERIAVTVDNSSTSVSACSPASSVGHPVSDTTETPSTMKNSGKQKLWCWIPHFIHSLFPSSACPHLIHPFFITNIRAKHKSWKPWYIQTHTIMAMKNIFYVIFLLQ